MSPVDVVLTPGEEIPLPKGKFVIVIERGDRYRTPMLMTDENDNAVRFNTRQEARAAAHGAMWERTWVWWIVELDIGGKTVFGTDVKL